MPPSRFHSALRDVAALLVAGLFAFPTYWWLLTSIKPLSAVFDRHATVFFDFTPTLANYAVTLGGVSPFAIEPGLLGGDNVFDSRMPLLSSTIVALGSAGLCLLLGTPAAYALSRLRFRGRGLMLAWLLWQRMLPPIALIIPLVAIMHGLSLYDSHGGLILAHGLINLPLATLILKSFFDDVPVEVDEAAMLDGATRWQTFGRIVLPMVRGGVAAAAILCFIFSWTEFLMAVFLTSAIQTVPVKITAFGSSMGQGVGLLAALGTSALLPGFAFILLVQRHLVRGLSLGALREG